DAINLTKEKKPIVAVVDLSIDQSIGPASGLMLIQSLLVINPIMRIIVLTGQDIGSFGIEALRHGAASFINKPVEIDHLWVLIQDAATFAQLKLNYLTLKIEHEATSLSSKSPKMKEVLQEIAFASSSNQPVLILGETGTGKGVTAQ